MHNQQNTEPGLDGKSTEALIQTDFSLSATKEKSLELLMGMAQKLANGSTEIAPIIIGMMDGNFTAIELKQDPSGQYVLPEFKSVSQKDLKRKSRAVKKIMSEITPVLHAEIEQVTYVALVRKDQDKLNKILDALNSGVKPKLENRVGCIWLVIGEFECVI